MDFEEVYYDEKCTKKMDEYNKKLKCHIIVWGIMMGAVMIFTVAMIFTVDATIDFIGKNLNESVANVFGMNITDEQVNIMSADLIGTDESGNYYTLCNAQYLEEELEDEFVVIKNSGSDFTDQIQLSEVGKMYTSILEGDYSIENLTGLNTEELADLGIDADDVNKMSAKEINTANLESIKVFDANSYKNFGESDFAQKMRKFIYKTIFSSGIIVEIVLLIFAGLDIYGIKRKYNVR